MRNTQPKSNENHTPVVAQTTVVDGFKDDNANIPSSSPIEDALSPLKALSLQLVL